MNLREKNSFEKRFLFENFQTFSCWFSIGLEVVEVLVVLVEFW